MLTKVVEVGSIEILPDKVLQVREDTVVLEDGVEISRTYTRYVLNPGDDVDTKPVFVKDLSVFLWTPEVISAWKEKADQLSKFPVGL